jgi:thiol-disulfide isomerase/thioredoxin
VLLDFWATWCKPCIAEIPYLAKAKEQFGNQNFEIISVCIDRPEFKPQWNKIIESHGHHWVQLFDAAGETSKDYSIKAFPTIVLLDPEGKVIISSADPATAGFRRDAIINKLAEIFPKP